MCRFKQAEATFVSFECSTNGITAAFILPDDDAHLLRVSLDRECIIRILDEMPLSTEENDTPNEGLVSAVLDCKIGGDIWRFGPVK